ncbi:MAG TPA: response regulator, partial [Bacteroidales bacterium]|nr:response regulator [Bacteroidales bacterium]
QADLKITRPHEGSGLGLSIVKAYIDMLGGEIWLDSEPEKGSVFTFALPHQSVANASDPEKQESIKSDFKKESLILIAEDDEVSQMLTEKILRKEGFRTVFASNGNQAIEQLVLKPDLILLDLKMPGLSGFDTARAIRITHPDIPIVALTAYALAGDREKALSAGCNAYITKPLSKALLLKTLKKFLS